jgi:flagellar hook-associated protein 2
VADVSLDSISNLSPELQRAFQAAVKAERKPMEKIEERRGLVEEKVKLLDDVIGRMEGVRSLLPNLNSPIAIRELAFASGDDHILTGTADKSAAEPGKHTLEVMQLAKSASALSNRFSDSDQTRIGSGYFTFTTADGDTRDIYIDNENSTLSGISRIINSAGMGMKATVVRDEADPELPFRLILTSDKTGVGGEVEFPEFYFVDGESDFYVEDQKAASNALIRYEGFDIESPTNEIKDLIRGVTLNVKGLTNEGRPVTVSIEQDLPKTTVKVKDLVEGLNSVFSFIQQQNTMDENSNTAKTLGGDYGIRLAEDRLKGALRENFLFSESNVQTMRDIGIEFDKKGMLHFDEKKFQHKLSEDFDGVVTLLAGDGKSFGVIPKLSNALRSITGGPDTLLTAQKKNYSSQVAKFNEDLTEKEKRAELKMTSLKDKLAKAQAAITKMQGQANYFSSQGPGQGGGLPVG